MLATLTGNKREYVMACLQASAMLSDRGVVGRLVIIGDGPERSTLEQAAANVCARHPQLTVDFVGAMPRPWARLSTSQIVVGMGMVALEAGLRGHSVVCASSDGIGGELRPDTMGALSTTNFTGRGIRPLSVTALADVLSSALERNPDPGLAEAIRYEHGERAAASWIELWDRLCP